MMQGVNGKLQAAGVSKKKRIYICRDCQRQKTRATGHHSELIGKKRFHYCPYTIHMSLEQWRSEVARILTQISTEQQQQLGVESVKEEPTKGESSNDVPETESEALII
eukprot:TRINITY_DN67789_c0_g1_i1.p1 TRINITY_DN67789_c0_g1~~TRINITY_DN67789_c0_g1_i1.p1  ORF type:complete len:108 (+),score=8.75 TRINITY_DN67789_c0_g1_i1:3-326(+)